MAHPPDVIPAKAGIQASAGAGGELDPCLRRGDSRWGGRCRVSPPSLRSEGADFVCDPSSGRWPPSPTRGEGLTEALGRITAVHTHRMSSLRTQGSRHQLEQGESWTPAFAGMTAGGVGGVVPLRCRFAPTTPTPPRRGPWLRWSACRPCGRRRACWRRSPCRCRRGRRRCRGRARCARSAGPA